MRAVAAWRGRRAAAFAAFVGLAGCNALSGADALSVGATAENDLEPPPRDTARTTGAEAGAPVGHDDGGAIPDAAADAPAGAKTFCATSAATFCADFDEGQRDAGWARAEQTGGGSLLLDTKSAASPPAALRATLPVHDEGGVFYQDLSRTFPAGFRGIRVEADLFVDPIAWNTRNGSVALAEVYWTGGTAASGQLLEITRRGARVTTVTSENASPTFTSAGVALPTSAWTHVAIEAIPRTSGASVKLWIDGTLVVNRADLALAGADATTIEVWIGLARYERPTPAFDVRYDNVQMTLL